MITTLHFTIWLENLNCPFSAGEEKQSCSDLFFSIFPQPQPKVAMCFFCSLHLEPVEPLCTNCTLLSLLIYLVMKTRAGECSEDNQRGVGPSNSGLCPGKLDPRTIFLVSFTHPCFPFHHFGLYLR